MKKILTLMAAMSAVAGTAMANEDQIILLCF